ncbi:MAG: hypothetical protein HOP02_16700 [Methylococcaceae bacterium]|nr:hypothetical protein [Methylococcaceae bacterium]
MNRLTIYKKSCLALLGLIFSASLWAHGGAAGTDTDQCKFELEPNHWIHYTAYQSKTYPGQDFCGSIPAVGTLTQLVFDYQDMKYRDMAVEFEVTKEPEGTRVFFEEAKKHKSGTVALSLPNGVAEKGKYLIHITLLKDDGARLDAHMGFKAGAGEATSTSTYGLYALFAFAALYVFYLLNAGFKRQVDGVLAKLKS